MKLTLTVILFALSGVYSASQAATLLPVGPITFSTNADYDNSFREPAPFSAIRRDSAGYLTLNLAQTGMAVYDTSSSGGGGGFGGTSGSLANNDLGNMIISGRYAGATSQGAGMGFFLRLDNNDSGGYFAAVTTMAPFPTQVLFQLYEHSSTNSIGVQIYSTTISPAAYTFTANTFYSFQLTAIDGVFSFDFNNGMATASFTDPTVSSVSGQVGFALSTYSVSAITYFDDFAIAAIPEPSYFIPILLTFVAVLWYRKTNSRTSPSSESLARRLFR